ncbi:MAG: glycoside hydrolase family 9 protein, partial [Cyclobacteriaceae bacterium]|nr:glycoside hydrolase family 9 protein [Cyclobacteriaceae bacterium]
MTQCLLYRKMTGDEQFIEMETRLRDWLFGVNPWGTVMIVGYPGVKDYPMDPHSSLNYLKGFQTDGGLVDGPVYGNIYYNLKGIGLQEPDEYEMFQSAKVVYHDDVGDFSTNEPTMDGTAMLMYYFAYLSR